MYKSPASDTHVIFGEAKIEDLGAQARAWARTHAAASPQLTARPRTQQAQSAAAEHFKAADLSSMPGAASSRAQIEARRVRSRRAFDVTRNSRVFGRTIHVPVG